jgi:DNA-binding NarL/FixJ family response regulator
MGHHASVYISSGSPAHATAVRTRVLIAESRILVQEALAALLGSIDGIEVVGRADSAADAVERAAELKPQVVLLSTSGAWGTFAVAAQFAERCPGVKVVLLDDRALDVHAREALRIGAAGYLTKEQPIHQIESALRRAAHGERVFAPEIAARLVLSADGVRLAADSKATPLASLTPREMDVLVHLAQGYSVKQCAKALGIGTSTAGNHKSRLMKKLNVHKTVDLTRLAIREGLVPEGRDTIVRPHIRDFDAAV